MDQRRTLRQQRLNVAWCVAGILGSLLLYGVLQVNDPTCETMPPTQAFVPPLNHYVT